VLSKSAAKAFFLVGTALCGGAFILLTLDTIKRVPAQTNAIEITESVKRGKHLWDTSNCMGCHTLMGEGAYYAPELTKVVERRGEAFIKSMLKDPEKMFPGERKMQNYKFSDEQIADLYAFLQWIGKVDLNGFPPKPDLAPQSAAPVANAPAVFTQMCTACHSLKGNGGNVGPALDGIGSRRTAEYITEWLKDPVAVKADSKMAKMPLSESDISELTLFLAEQKN
jgi:nitric oxide reductase subunit C